MPYRDSSASRRGGIADTSTSPIPRSETSPARSSAHFIWGPGDPHRSPAQPVQLRHPGARRHRQQGVQHLPLTGAQQAVEGVPQPLVRRLSHGGDQPGQRGHADILSCTPADLVATTAENVGVRKTATGDLPTPPANVAKLRPRAARILPDA
nr:hypothetical protein [Streptomyces lydicus]